jgi:hypothetical protein
VRVVNFTSYPKLAATRITEELEKTAVRGKNAMIYVIAGLKGRRKLCTTKIVRI